MRRSAKASHTPSRPILTPSRAAFALSLGLIALGGAGCEDDPSGLDAGIVEDAGGNLPDARVLPMLDLGAPDANGPLPTISNVSPASGPVTGGTRVTLRGTSFTEPAEVFFGETPATSVVVLDEVSVAATSPEGSLGPVTVRVITPGGEAELPEGFTYQRELLLTGVEPARIPERGGVAVAIVGKGFDENTIVLMDRQPLRGARLVSDTRIEGFAPALAPGRPEIRVMHRESSVRRSDLLHVFAIPQIEAIAPGYAPINGGTIQELIGDGFEAAQRVSLGIETASGLTLISGERLTVEAPALSLGVYDAKVENEDVSDTLENAFVVFDPAVQTLEILGLLPNKIEVGSAATLTLVGHNFKPDAQVVIGGLRIPIGELGSNTISVVVPATLAVGSFDVQVISGGETATLPNGLQVYAPVEVTGISPTEGPATGGTQVTITGVGFAQGLEVRIADIPLADVQVVSDTEITGRTVAGTHGAHDVVVRQARQTARLVDGFSFLEAFEVIRIEPTEGSVAGNTYVSVIGRGFSSPVAVQFGGVEGIRPALENGSVIGVRTPPAGTGPVDVAIQTGTGDRTLLGAFRYYDPRLITGGAWGGPIEGSVNVAVATFGGDPLPGMVVQLGFDADLQFTAVTDENGLATISSPQIRGSQTVTAGAPNVEFVTFYEVNARNLTLLANPYPMSMPPDAPVQPCPMGAQPPTVRGKIFKFKSSLDPVTMPGWVPVARITYTQPNVFTANPPEPPEQFDFVFQDGGEYEIVVMRVGTVAVYATLGDFNPETQQFIPRRMGIVRNVPVAPETVTEDMHIELNIALDQTTNIRLDDPPNQAPGPSINAIFPFLNLQSEGVIPFPATAIFGDATVLVQNLPNLPESQFFYMGGSFTQTPQGGLGNPFSLSLIESASAFEEGLDMGPFLHMPQNVSPKISEVLQNREVSWEQAGITPDLTTINVVDSVSVGGCCCMDINGNGSCEEEEPQQCGGLPQQFNRWSVYAQGGEESYIFPRMPPGVIAFDTPRGYPWLLQQAIAPRFNYAEFIYNQFSPFFWQSWTVWSSQFVVREETD